jgi:hypothetical protein
MQAQALTECESALQTKMDLKSLLSEDVCVHAMPPPDARPPMLCGGVSRSGGGGVSRSGGGGVSCSGVGGVSRSGVGGVSRFGEGVPQRDPSAPPTMSAISTSNFDFTTSNFDFSVPPKNSAQVFEKVVLKASYTSSLRPYTLVA